VFAIPQLLRDPGQRHPAAAGLINCGYDTWSLAEYHGYGNNGDAPASIYVLDFDTSSTEMPNTWAYEQSLLPTARL